LSAARARRDVPTRAERQAATRAALLQAATRTIVEHGMDAASIDRIAADAGYTKGAFYANFSSKEELFLVMLEEKFGAELDRIGQIMVGAEEATAEARHAAEDFLAYVDSDPQWARLYQEFALHAARDESFRVEFAARQRTLRARLAEVYERWAATLGIVPALPHSDVAAMSAFMADGFLLQRTIDPSLDDSLYATMCEVFLRGLASMSGLV
jgi:AcrR family transcriptional regulator